jgi:hypothetical protein
MKKVPILFLIFNREEIALKSFESIKKYHPATLFIAADGPRVEKSGEFELCERTRNSVLQAIDWDCDVKTLFRDENLGCTNAIASAISWFFSNEEYGIIIEDDCLIHPDFYRLCEILLPQYCEEEKIMLITAQNHTPDLDHADQLVFSNECCIWGWASWRRTWNKVDMQMTQWPKYKFRNLVRKFGIFRAYYIYHSWQKQYKGQKKLNWDSPLFFYILKTNGLTISSNVRLSVNLGIETGGVNYEKGDIDPYKHIPFGSIKWPIQIPNKIEATKEKLIAEKKEFYRIRLIGLKKKLCKFMKSLKINFLLL